MRIVESKLGGVHAFTVYPESEQANELIRDLARYAIANQLFFTVGPHEADPRRLMHISELTPSQALDFRKQWGQYLTQSGIVATGSL